MNKKIDNVKIAYIGGGSQNWARTLMKDLLLQDELSGEVLLYDIDLERATLNESLGKVLSEHHAAQSTWTFTAVSKIEQALQHADIVIISILPGTFEDMRNDIEIAEKYGIYQSVGDTVGVGGFRRALRTIPDYIEIAKAIKEFAPDAWVINYTNPMSICTRILYAVFPKIKSIGCCHEVLAVKELLAEMLHENEYPDVKAEEIDVNVLGINHFTWVTQASYQNIDLFPMYQVFVSKYREQGFSSNHMKNHDHYFRSKEKVKFNLFETYESIAAAGDRHLVEFFPNNRYLETPKFAREKWGFELTPIDYRIEQQKVKEEQITAYISEELEFPMEASSEEGVDIIKALLGGTSIITNVNMPNKGQVEGLPLDVVVETNAQISRDSVRPIFAGKLPKGIEALTRRHVSTQEGIIDKIYYQKEFELKDLFFLEPQIEELTKKELESLFEEIIAEKN